MKKLLLYVCVVILVLCLVGCGSSNKNYSGHASEIWYSCDTSSAVSMSARQIQVTDADFEYINSNTIKITDSNGNVIIIDSSKLEIIKVDSSK